MTSRFSHNFWSEWIENQSGNFFENNEFELFSPNSPALDADPSEKLHLTRKMTSSVPAGCEIFLPEKYEHKYAYPLLIWLHGEGGNENDLHSVMPNITDQNFLGLSFRGNQPVPNSRYGRTWNFNAWEMDRFEEHLHDTVCKLRSEFHIHSERIFVAGHGSGAKVAFDLIQNRPAWFGGALIYGGRLFQDNQQIHESIRDAKGTRVLLSLGSHDHPKVMADHVMALSILQSAGMEVSTRIYDAHQEMTREMYRDINYWIMEAVCSPASL